MFRIIVTSDGALQRIAGALARRAGELDVPLREAGQKLADRARARLREGRFAPLSPRTVAEKRRKGYPATPLVRTGRLAASIGFDADGGGLTLGSPLPYAAVHQFGSGRVPARPFLDPDDEDRRIVADAVAAHLAAALEG